MKGQTRIVVWRLAMANRDLKALQRASEAATAARIARKLLARRCPAVVGNRVCGHLTTQNPEEEKRGVWWCPRCRRYTDGSKGLSVTRAAERGVTPQGMVSTGDGAIQNG